VNPGLGARRGADARMGLQRPASASVARSEAKPEGLFGSSRTSGSRQSLIARERWSQLVMPQARVSPVGAPGWSRNPAPGHDGSGMMDSSSSHPPLLCGSGEHTARVGSAPCRHKRSCGGNLDRD